LHLELGNLSRRSSIALLLSQDALLRFESGYYNKTLRKETRTNVAPLRQQYATCFMKRLGLALVIVGLLVSIGAPAAWAAPAEASSLTHVVRPGENLYRIALRYGTTVSAIAAANHISNPNRIYVGQRLIIPSGPGPVHGGGTIYVVRRGDTLSRIAFRYGVNVWAIVRANGLRNPNYIYAGQRLVIPSGPYHPRPGGTYYTVRRGDTLAGIAWRFGVNMWAIVRANGISNPNYIYAGRVLWIP
jgi:LysM repeat protein